MDHKQISSACQQVYKQFPEMKGINPEVKSQGNDQTLLIFQTSAKTANGQNLPRLVRAVLDKKGKIVKLTTSR